MAIIGTAGHVDHGKSTLVQALTGIDPDRLAEEKRRGMTIDLGFAHLDLPSGERAGIVDVPGHARFLHNMLAGVHGMDAVLLVVAADEGVMPQTREHLDIVELMGVGQLVVALTKIDLVGDDMVALASADVAAELGRRGLAAPVIPVSAPAGRGLGELLTALAAAVAEASAPDRGRPRLPVDRAFAMPGFGTVVTGSLADGVLRVGQELELLPAERPRRARVRGLQQHNRQATEARPGSRVAVNLQGVDHGEVRRGQVLALPGTVRQTVRIDARVRVLPGADRLRHNMRVRVHAGTAEVPARLVLLGVEDLEAGTDGWVQLRLAAPLAVREGDRLVLRRLSPPATVAGGSVADAAPDAHRRARWREVTEALAARAELEGRVAQALARARRGSSAAAIAAALAEPLQDVETALASMRAASAAVDLGGTYWEAARWAESVAETRARLDAYHGANPLRPGMPSEELRRLVGADGLAQMEAAGVLERRGQGTVALAGWEPRLSEAERRDVDSIVARLGADPLSPPRLSELGPGAAALCQYLEQGGRVVRIAPDLYLLAEAVDAARARLVAHLQQTPAVTVAGARDVLGSTRKVVVPLLEHFDAAHVTVREGDTRRLWRANQPIDSTP